MCMIHTVSAIVCSILSVSYPYPRWYVRLSCPHFDMLVFLAFAYIIFLMLLALKTKWSGNVEESSEILVEMLKIRCLL